MLHAIHYNTISEFQNKHWTLYIVVVVVVLKFISNQSNACAIASKHSSSIIQYEEKKLTNKTNIESTLINKLNIIHFKQIVKHMFFE